MSKLLEILNLRMQQLYKETKDEVVYLGYGEEDFIKEEEEQSNDNR